MLNRTEILAPAGNYDAVRAAVNAKADAIYLGGSLFSARAFAGNFDEKELLETIDYCHMYDVKVYMAINTLLKNDEIKRLPSYVEPYYREGVDGIIVQDMGVAEVLSMNFPDLPLHGSTQLSVSSEYGAAFLKSIGMTRFVPSRELSLDEIKAIKSKIDIEIETFVHGAMCYCYSGRCLMSSYAGGRSGNRGRCAQPCRKKYQLDGKQAYMLSLKDMCMLGDIGKLIDAGIDSFKIEGRMKKPEYVAATTYAYRELRDACLSGCKDLGKLAERYENMLKDVYNRGGFYSGYYFTGTGNKRNMLADQRPNHTGIMIGEVSGIKKPYIDISLCEDVHAGDIIEIRTKSGDIELTCNADVELSSNSRSASGNRPKGDLRLKGKAFHMLSSGDHVYRTRNNKLLNTIKADVIEKDRRIELKADVKALIGEKISLTLSMAEDGREALAVTAEGPECMTATNKPVTENQIIDKIKKTGGTAFEISDITADVDENMFVQISAVNNLRREAVEKMQRLLTERFAREGYSCDDGRHVFLEPKNKTTETLKTAKPEKALFSGMTVAVSTEEHVKIVKNYKWITNVIVDYNIRQYVDELKKAGFKTIIALPEIMRQRNVAEYMSLSELLEKADGVMVRNLDEFGYLVADGFDGIIIADAGLYIYNDFAVQFYKRYIQDLVFVAPQELTLDEIDGLSVSPLIKMYGYQKVMVTSNCIVGNYKNGCAGKHSCCTEIVDDMGNSFYVKNNCSDCCNVIFNGVPTSLLDKTALLSDVLHDTDLNGYIEFTIEDGESVRNILDHADNVMNGTESVNVPIKEFTRGHYYKGID